MKCAWQELLSILPIHMRKDVDRLGKDTMQELRLRISHPPELVCTDGSCWLPNAATCEDISFVIHTASRYSPWAATTITRGFITAEGGHRIGLCGDAVTKEDKPAGIRIPTSLCIRVARDFPGIAVKAGSISGNVLILGPPGSGKTTLLRDLIRQISNSNSGSVAVVDERGELFPTGFYTGRRTDVLTGCKKADAIDMLIRTMSPACIAVDEITELEECNAVIRSCGCGVRILATAHGASHDDLKQRPIYRSLLKSKVFETVLIMDLDKRWRAERIGKCL